METPAQTPETQIPKSLQTPISFTSESSYSISVPHTESSGNNWMEALLDSEASTHTNPPHFYARYRNGKLVAFRPNPLRPFLETHKKVPKTPELQENYDALAEVDREYAELRAKQGEPKNVDQQLGRVASVGPSLRNGALRVIDVLSSQAASHPRITAIARGGALGLGAVLPVAGAALALSEPIASASAPQMASEAAAEGPSFDNQLIRTELGHIAQTEGEKEPDPSSVVVEGPEYSKQNKVLKYNALAHGPYDSVTVDLLKKSRHFKFKGFETDDLSWHTYRRFNGAIAGASRQGEVLEGQSTDIDFNLKMSKTRPIGKKACATFRTVIESSGSSTTQKVKKCTEVAKPYFHGIGYYTPYTHSPIKRSTRNSPTFKKAVTKYLDDPYQTQKWAGDYESGYGYSVDMFKACPDLPKIQNPRFTLRYKKKQRKFIVRFDAGMDSKYCFLVGKYTETAILQIKNPGDNKYSNCEDKFDHTDGLREQLVFYGMPANNFRVKAVFSDLKNNCKAWGPYSLMRIKLIERFKWDPNQTFQHEQGSNNTRGPSSKRSYFSEPIEPEDPRAEYALI